MTYVLLGHVYEVSTMFPLLNILTMQSTILGPWWHALITGGFYSVDVFFFMSGFLTFALLPEKFYGKKIRIVEYLMIYVH